MSFQKSLQENLGQHDPIEVDELVLDDLYKNIENFTSDHKHTLEKYTNLIHLSLNNFGLKSITNFPKLPNLKSLEIRQNKLNGSDFAELKSLYPNLQKLKVGDNPLKSIEIFKVFTQFPNLRKIELSESEIAKKETYRDELFRLLPEVEVIDRMTRDGDEIDTTLNEEDGEDESFDEDDFEGEDEDDEFDEDGDNEDEEFEDDDESDDAPKGKKPKY
jgi:hypothetical protein